ncbi:MAG: methionyl-tRNA synthetase [Candidatus Peribacteria bacterium]|nr:methionyl-tRNA synthetase [Candidatus Peribacteria bacterium]
MSRRYITTAIDYPNAPPHMGHAMEKVLADVCARWFRLSGHDVRFQTGTDEHGIKIQRKAEEEGMTPQALVDRNVPLFQSLYSRLHISYDVFVRTTDREKHWPTVQALWKKLQEAGALEKRTYVGLYCAGCERFLTKRDLADGTCPIHHTAPEEVSEENWFFRMKEKADYLKTLLVAKDGYVITPDSRAHETLSLLEQGLEDVSFSRPQSSLSWGIPVPGDENQVMYVWCDALTNYISGLGYFTDHEDKSYWEDAEVTHVIGKDIARFHALIWPAMLHYAGIKTPNRLLIHGFLTSEGEKMSKSLGNVVVPDDVIAKYGVDPLRFYLSHEIPVGNDGDFSWKRFGELYDAKLRNQLGNLLNRVLVMLQKLGGDLSDIQNSAGLKSIVASGWSMYAAHMDAFQITDALATDVMSCVSAGNQSFNDKAPWTEKDDEKRRVILAEYVELLRHIALMLLPFMPETAQKISRQLNVPYAERMLEKDFTIDTVHEWGSLKDWKKVGIPEILFAPVE